MSHNIQENMGLEEQCFLKLHEIECLVEQRVVHTGDIPLVARAFEQIFELRMALCSVFEHLSPVKDLGVFHT